MWFIGVEVEQETSAPPPKKNPGSAPDMRLFEYIWLRIVELDQSHSKALFASLLYLHCDSLSFMFVH